jgi:tRNA dimethylallyltransferase
MLKTFLPEREASMPDTSDDDDDDDDDVDILSLEERRAMHERLRELDPKAAARLHPKDARRVRRYLQIAEEANGEESLLPSTIFKRKKDKAHDDERKQQNEQQLMFPPTVTRVIHVVAENEALEKTLETRLERMRHDGVEKEIKTFIETYPTAAKSNTGVAQAIGVREFRDETDDDTETRFEKMCARTKRLARRQRRQFANMVESSEFRSAPTIEIDATKMHEMLAASPPSSSKANAFWEEEVVSRAVRFITEEFVDDVNAPSTKKSTRRDVIVDLEENNDAWIERACEACGDRIFRGDRDWLAHTSSKRHKNRVRNLKKSREGERGSLHPNKIAAI